MPSSETTDAKTPRIAAPPQGMFLLFALGPSIVWCSEYIGSGEVILATRVGAILGTGVIWAVVVGVFLKFVIGLAGGWYTVATGESMMDLFARMPGPKNTAVWLILFAQLVASTFAIGAVASSAGTFLGELTGVSHFFMGWAVAFFAFAIAWIGEFRPLKIIMTTLVGITLLGLVVTLVRVFPPLSQLIAGLAPQLPSVPQWAVEAGVSSNAWSEVLPLLGWGAGGFASQVWYTYWIMGAGYGAAAGDRQGKPADEQTLRNLTDGDVQRLGGWRRMVTFDAIIAMVVGTGATLGFLIVGAQILGANQTAPEGSEVALQLAAIFGSEWGQTGANLFLLGGGAALVSTLAAQVTGWPLLLDDATRICMPGAVSRWSPVTRRRVWLVYFLLASMVIVYTLGVKPVALVRFSAIVEGLLLTPLQALGVFIGLYWVMPKMFEPAVANRLRPGLLMGLGLILSFLFFSCFCAAYLPSVLAG